MARQQRIDSATAAVEIMGAALRELRPPAHMPLTDSDEPYWSSVVAEKAKSEWTAHDLEMAALLVTSMRKLAAEESTLDDEGSVIVTTGGNPAANPRLRVVADLHARIIKYRQTLGIHSRGKVGEQRDVERRRDAAKELEQAHPFGDDLIARPSIQ